MLSQLPLPSSQSKTTTFLLLLPLLPLYFISYHYHLRHHDQQIPVSSFSTQWLQTDLIQPWNPSAIRSYCDQKSTMKTNITFNLPNANGGVGNIRAEFLDFLFYAIEIGVSGIVLPGMAKRSEEELFDVWGGGKRETFGFMFDEKLFRDRMGEVCPDLKILSPPQDGNLSSFGKVVDAVYDPRVPISRRQSSREQWRTQTEDWTKSHGVENDQIVNVERTMWETDTRGIPAGIRRNLGMLVQVRPDVRRYAGIVMENFSKKFPTLGLDPRDRIHENAFYGAHLRTEADTITAGWMAPAQSMGWNPEKEVGLNFSAQTDRYIDAAVKNGLRVIYAASGNESEVERFARKAEANRPPLKVVDKWDFLSERDAKQLKDMHWDQQALVDLEILKRCSVFGGMAKSSFAFTIAMARTEVMEERGTVQDPWFASKKDLKMAFDNGLNTIWGRNQLNEERVPRGAWP